ncbi:MAG: HAD family phosphatase [Thermomicrobiales bacterium]|nr:HAD family phosphatase [Thermomicrobiales bacterium]
MSFDSVPQTGRITAFIFDMDGLLVDSEPLGRATMIALLRQYGREWQPDAGRNMAGRRLPEVMTDVATTYGLTATIDELCLAFDSQFIGAVPGQVALLPGVREVMAFGRTAGMRLALASSGWRPYVDAILTEAGLAGVFDAEVTGDEVTHGKPHPAPFLLAASRLGVAPSECVVFEDAPAGVQAAVAAGMHAVAVPRGSTLHAPFPVAPHASFGSLHEALPWLRARGVGRLRP